MTTTSRSIDRIILPTDSTVPIARSGEYDTYFRITRSDDPHLWAVSALHVITSVTGDLPQSSLDSGSRIHLLDAVAIIVGDATTAVTSAEQSHPMPAPTEPDTVDVPDPPDDDTARALQRWKRGHHLFHLFVISMNSRLDSTLDHLATRRWADLDRRLLDLGVLYAGATASMRYASDFPARIYSDFVRPSMEPPWLEPGFSAVFNRDHDLMLSRAKLVRSALKSATLPSSVAETAKQLWRSQSDNRRAHQMICQRFVPGGDSLLQHHFDNTDQTN